MPEITKTDVSLEKHIEVQLKGLELRIEQARISMEKRLDAMNEFREALKDQSAKSPTRSEVSAQVDALKHDIRILNEFKESRAGTLADIQALQDDVKKLNTFKDSMDGKASQKSVSNLTMFSIFGLMVAVLGIIMRFLGM